MTKDEALKLALHDIERYQIKRQDFDRFENTVIKIKEALVQLEQEPDCRATGVCVRSGLYVAQPEQEPVASLTISMFRGHMTNHDIDYFGDLPAGSYQLYISPPKRKEWVGLTDDAIQTIEFGAADKESAVLQAQAKLKELNNG